MKFGDSQCNPARTALLCESLVDEAVSIASKRNDQMPHPAISIQGWVTCKWVSSARRYYKVFFIQDPVDKPRRDFVEGNDHDIDCVRLQLGESGLPGVFDCSTLMWRKKLPDADFDAGSRAPTRLASNGCRNVAETPSG